MDAYLSPFQCFLCVFVPYFNILYLVLYHSTLKTFMNELTFFPPNIVHTGFFLLLEFECIRAENSSELFSVCLSSVCPSIKNYFSHFHLLIQYHWANFKKIRHKTFVMKGISYLFKRRTLSFQRGDNNKIAKIQLRNLAKFQPNLGKNRVWRVQKFVLEMKGLVLFQGEIITEI